MVDADFIISAHLGPPSVYVCSVNQKQAKSLSQAELQFWLQAAHGGIREGERGK